VRSGLALAAIVAGLVVAPVIAFGAAKSRPQHGAPPPEQAQHQQRAQTAPSVSI
jgi:hypothetical protein